MRIIWTNGCMGSRLYSRIARLNLVKNLNFQDLSLCNYNNIFLAYWKVTLEKKNIIHAPKIINKSCLHSYIHHSRVTSTSSWRPAQLIRQNSRRGNRLRCKHLLKASLLVLKILIYGDECLVVWRSQFLLPSQLWDAV